jgi:hypothetical protein
MTIRVFRSLAVSLLALTLAAPVWAGPFQKTAKPAVVRHPPAHKATHPPGNPHMNKHSHPVGAPNTRKHHKWL